MKVISLTCPSCGAQVSLSEGQTITRCRFCGAQVYLDDEIQRIEQHIQYDNAEEAGYSFEKGRQRAQMEIDPKWQQPQYQQTVRYENQWVPPQQIDQPKKRNTLLWVLGWIFFFPIPLGILLYRNRDTEVGKAIIWGLGWLCIFPVPLTILMLRKKDMPPMQRNGIIAGAWVIYLLLIAVVGIMTPQTEPSDRIDDTSRTSSTTSIPVNDEQAPEKQTQESQTENAPVSAPISIEQPPVAENTMPQEEQLPVVEEVSPNEEQLPPVQPEPVQSVPIDNSQLAVPNEEQVINQEPNIPQASVTSPNSTEQGDTNNVVYIVPNGKSYHQRRDCPSLSQSKEILEVSLEDAIAQGKADPCNNCVR